MALGEAERLRRAADREARLRRVWARFLAATGFPDDRDLSIEARRRVMVAAIAGGFDARRIVATALEAAEIGADFDAEAAEPSAALPGTAAKVEVMAARLAAGVELFAAGDAPARHLEPWERSPRGRSDGTDGETGDADAEDAEAAAVDGERRRSQGAGEETGAGGSH